jgi:hypothetical protein
VDDLKVSGALQGFIEDETRLNNKHASKPMFKMSSLGQKKINPRLSIYLWLSGAENCLHLISTQLNKAAKIKIIQNRYLLKNLGKCI